MSEPYVLVSWVAKNNDPFERVFGSREYRNDDGEYVSGPTLTLLFDEDSPYINKISDVVLLCRDVKGDGKSVEMDVAREVIAEIEKKDSKISCSTQMWSGSDPTDHLDIFAFLKKNVPRLRGKYIGRNLIIHISPGTPSMQTIWVLMGESGFIDPPFELVKSYRKQERRGRPAVVPVKLGIENFYKVHKLSRPVIVSSDTQSVWFDPAKFRSAQMKKLFAEANRFARLNVPIMILGERGTGKTTLASWIRSNSPFRNKKVDKKWPAVACGQYSQETMRAELFGYKKGSFTGADADKDGLLAAADKDTLFLDEIGDVGHDLQRLLIRALEEKIYSPLGSNESISSDFRLLTATNLEAHQLAEQLDKDFLDRISMFILRVPPLREIVEDFNWLWEEVFKTAQRRAGVQDENNLLSKGEHAAIVRHLTSQRLSGNLRDFFRVAYRIIAAKLDKDVILSSLDAVEYGVLALKKDLAFENASSISRCVANSFCNNESLAEALKLSGDNLKLKKVLKSLQRYMAEEIRSISKQHGVSCEDLCDVSERTLRKWVELET